MVVELPKKVVQAAVARSTGPSQTITNTSVSERFLAVEPFKKCTLLWRKAHVEVKMRTAQ